MLHKKCGFLIDGRTWMIDPLSRGVLLSKGGDLIVSDDFCANDFQAVRIPTPSVIKTVDISNSPIETLEGIPNLPRIRNFKADKTKIHSLKGFMSIKGCTTISLRSTPLSESKFYRLSIVVFFGNSLVSIDGKEIPKSLRQKASEYPTSVRNLLNKGWAFVYPCPTDDEIDQICESFQVSNYPTDSTAQIFAGKSEEDLPGLESMIEDMRKKQTEMHKRAKKLFGIEETLSDKLVDQLGIEADAANDDAIATEVERLCMEHKL